jgi:methionyl-tRNA synthetase
MLVKYNLNDVHEKYHGVFNKSILSAESQQIPFDVSMLWITPGNSTHRHNHLDTEFITIISGEGEIRTSHAKFHVRAGDVFYIEPFTPHTITNTESEIDLVFTSCWWVIPAQIKKLIENDLHKKNMLPKRTIIVSSFPTPNGPLHLGHLSGPFVAEDIYARFLKQHGKSVYLTCGLDQNQSWCALDERGAKSYSLQIKKTLDSIQFQPDSFIETMIDEDYKNLTQDLFSNLLSSGMLYSKMCPVFICKKTGRFLADSEVVATCPHCNTRIRGNNCEECFSFVNDDEMIDPIALDTSIQLTTVQKERIFFPLSHYKKILQEFIVDSASNGQLKRVCLNLLNASLPDVPITHYYPWGIPCEDKNLSGQNITYYFEQITRLIHSLQKVSDVSDSITQIVRFFGIDNTFMYTLFAPALIFSIQPSLLTKLASNGNHYYLLEDKKFSTSRKHAVWADDCIEKFGSDITRFYLTLTRPEETKSNFTIEGLVDFCKSLQHDTVWIKELIATINCRFNGMVPEAGSWDGYQENYFLELHEAVNSAFNYLQLNNFSMQEYALVILDILKSVKRLRKHTVCYTDSDDLKAYYRTSLALQASTAHVLSLLIWPVMPEFGSKLYHCLGFEGDPLQSWKTLPRLLASSQKITNIFESPIFGLADIYINSSQ